jgi:hypothetical protein
MICSTQEPPPLRFVSDFVGKTVLNPVKEVINVNQLNPPSESDLCSAVYESLSILRAMGSLTVSTLG